MNRSFKSSALLLAALLSITSANEAQGLLRSWQGGANEDFLGWVVDSTSDHNADGRPELVISAPQYYSTGLNPVGTFSFGLLTSIYEAYGPGYVDVWSSAGPNPVHHIVGVPLFTGVPGNGFGIALDVQTDLDGDGIAELLISAPSEPASGGKLFAYSGVSGLLLWSRSSLLTTDWGPLGVWPIPSAPQVNYIRVKGIPDINNDGVPEIISTTAKAGGFFGIPCDGSCFVMSGSNQMLLSGNVNAGTLCSDAYPPYHTITTIPDWDGDGIDDIYATHLLSPIQVVVSSVTGASLANFPTSPQIFWSATASERIPDWNGDGIDDIANGCPYWPPGWPTPGSSVAITSGADLSLITSLTEPNPAFTGFGTSVKGGGDFNGDGVPDLLVGSPAAAPPLGNGNGLIGGYGKVWVFSGADNSVLHVYQGPVPDDGFGWSVAWAGDQNNDGFDDVLIGAPFSQTAGGINAGAAYLFAAAGPMSAGSGNVGAPAPFENVLFVDNDAGHASHWVYRGLTQPLTLSVLPPSTAFTADFVLFAGLGPPFSGFTFPTPIGDFAIVPALGIAGHPLWWTVVNSFYVDPTAIAHVGPAPWSYTFPNGVGYPIAVTLQAAIQSIGAPYNLAVSNALGVIVY